MDNALALFACKKDLYKGNDHETIPNQHILTLADAQRFVKKSVKQTLSSDKIVKIASTSPVGLSDITDNMVDSVYMMV